MGNQETILDSAQINDSGLVFASTRHRSVVKSPPTRDEPRLGRRESEPHSIEINYLYNVLKSNFSEGRVMWDLHHYLNSEFGKTDIQFDISFFKNLQIPYTLSSYDGNKFNNRPPDLAINILSKHTWKDDIGKNLDKCHILQIPIYLVFPSYHVATKFYKPPFMRVYILQESGNYDQIELREVAIVEDSKGNIVEKNPNAIIDVSNILPFRLGLLERNQKHDGGESLFRVVLIKPNSFELFLTSVELERKEKFEEKERADKERKRADKERKRADKEKERADRTEEKLNRFLTKNKTG